MEFDPNIPEDPTNPLQFDPPQAPQEPEMSEEEKRFKEILDSWNVADGDKTLRLDYPLNPKSIVFDVGGYKGDWAANIFCKYCCQVYVFEPIKELYDGIKKRFEFNNNVRVFNFALSGSDGSAFINKEIGDAISLFKVDDDPEKNETVILKDITTFLKEHKISIDLLKLNVEGSEYEILENLIRSGIIKSIKHIQIQFHDFFEDSKERREKIRESLSKTHIEKYNFEFIWEGWSKK